MAMKKIMMFFLLVFCGMELKADEQSCVFNITEQGFEPKEIYLPANQKVKCKVINATVEVVEFESHSLNREKIIPPQGQVPIFIGPLKPSEHDCFDEFHPTRICKVIIK